MRTALIAATTVATMSYCKSSSIETCRPNVGAGNRGFCNPNPRLPKSRVHHKRWTYNS